MADRSPRILLVDDEQAIQTLLSYPLQKDGYEVVCASDGREALARFGEGEYDLVVLDVMMPRLDGWETLARLRADPETAGLKVLMLSARAMDADLRRGDRAGVDAYMTKPFDPDELVRTVRELAG